MRNLLLGAALACSLTAVGSLAAEGAFMGVSGTYNFKSKIEIDDFSDDDVQPQFGIKGGYDFGNFRVYGEYSYGAKANVKDDTDTMDWRTHDFVVGADFTPYITNNLKFVLGLYTGASWLDIKADGRIAVGGTTYNVHVSDNMVGYLLGAKIGGAYELNANNEIELGFKISKAWYDGDTSTYLDGDFKNLKYGAYLGYNYKF